MRRHDAESAAPADAFGDATRPIRDGSISAIARRTLISGALAVALLVGCTAARSASPAVQDITDTSVTPTGVAPTTGAGGSTSPATDAPTTPTTPLPTTSMPATTVTVPEDWDAFDTSLSDALVGSGAWGISVAVAKDGQIVHTAAAGVADPDTERAAVPTDRYRIASNSKVLTAIVVMQLVAQGKLSLDGAVTPRVAEKLGVTITEPGVADITVRELLSHTSGFDEYQRTFFGHRVDSCPEAAKLGLTNGLANPPGTAYLYSNMNFCILGLLIEDVTGKKYEDVVDDDLLHPLGIDDMRLAGTHDVRKGDVHHLSGELRNYMEVLYSAGAWVGTASDLVRILDSLDTTRPGWHPLDATAVGEMLAEPTVKYPFTGRWYGLGLRAWSDGSWGHTGTVENARSMVLHRPDGYTWAVMVNGDTPSNTDKLADLVDKAFAAVGISTPDVG